MACHALSLACLLLTAVASALQPNVTDVLGYARLRSWNNSTLYEVQANTDYEFNPYLIHLVGSRYGTRGGGDGVVRGVYAKVPSHARYRLRVRIPP